MDIENRGMASRAQRNGQLERSLSWVDSHIDTFANNRTIFKGGDVENLKHSSELVLVCGLLISLKIEERWARATLDRLWKATFDCGHLFRDVLLARPDILAAISTYANFHTAGFLNQTVFAMCRQIAEFEWIDVLPMPMWRLIDVLNSLDRLGIRQLSSADISRCWVSRSPPISIMPTEIAYAITHEIFYISDFGRAKNRLTSSLTEYLRIALPIWQKHFLSDEDLDLSAEFILCERLALGSVDENLIAECVRRQSDDGSFKGPERVRKTIGITNDGFDAFRSDYHTTLVMCAVLASCRQET